MIPCPNCRTEMTAQAVEAYGSVRPLEIGACSACNLLWFDRSGSVSLTPRAVLGLFQFIGQAAGSARAPLASNFRCPRCAGPLALTYDLQRTTRFTYWRCARDQGQLISFNQFLREKNFIRAPTPAELARLRATVRQVACSQCGAPVDLTTDSACRHCGASIALIDPDGVAKAVHDLAGGQTVFTQPDPGAMGAALSDAQLNAIFDLERMREREGHHDLLAIGAGAIGALLAGLLLSR